MEYRNVNGLILIVLLTLILELAGCASTDPYHFKAWSEGNCLDNGARDCHLSYYQEHESYDLAFAEYTERGNAFNNEWIDEVLAKIDQREKQQGVVTIVFIHGWKLSAKEGDGCLESFKETLDFLARTSPLSNRRLVGVYIGWRGASIELPVLNQLTFWERKSVAEEVGKGGVTRLLLELNQIDRKHERNVLAIVGHSFGGAITVSATTEVLTEYITNGRQEKGQRNSIGDAVILLNPAIEANQTLNMVEAAIKQTPSHASYPLFVSISTDADLATHYFFPLGQTLNLLFTWRQKDLQRSYYHDRITNEALTLKEEHLDTTTTGNFAPYLTHRLSMEHAGDTSYPNLQPCDEAPDDCGPKGLTTLNGNPTIGPLPENYPLYFVKTDKTVMTGHNDIFNARILAFLMTLIDDVVRSAIADSGMEKDGRITQGNILSRPDEFKQRFGQFHNRMLDRFSLHEQFMTHPPPTAQ